jgi:ABC-2 type transport system permease protein
VTVLRVRYTVRVIRRVSALNLRARLQYRVDFITSVLLGVAWQTATLVFITALLTRFTGGLGNMPSAGVVLIVGMRLVSHGVYVLIFSTMNWMHQLVDEGMIDHYRIRPLPVLLQVLLWQFNVHAFGDLLAGLSALVVGMTLVAVHWTVGTLAFLVAAVISGTLLEAAVQVPVASLLLRSPATRAIGSWLDEIMATFGNYPLSILPSAVQALLTFVFPLAFVAYFPVLVLLGRASDSGVMAVVERCSPLAGPLLFVVALWFWGRSLRGYQSAGG